MSFNSIELWNEKIRIYGSVGILTGDSKIATVREAGYFENERARCGRLVCNTQPRSGTQSCSLCHPWEVPTYANDIMGPEVEAVRAHPEELVPLLLSEDMTVARRAVWATTFLETVPPFLIQPLAHTGLLTIKLIRAARAGALPNDPDELTEEKASSFFTQWTMAMERAGARAQMRDVLERIAAELESAELDEKLGRLASDVKERLGR